MVFRFSLLRTKMNPILFRQFGQCALCKMYHVFPLFFVFPEYATHSGCA